MFRKFFALFVFGILIFNFSASSAAEDQNLATSSVYDSAGLLTDTEIQTLTIKLHKIEKAHKIRIGINIFDTIGTKDPQYVANSQLDKYFSNGENGGICLIVAMESRDWWISTDVNMQTRITKTGGGFDYLRNAFVHKLTDGDFYGGCNAYLDTIDELMTYYEQNGHPYDPSEGFNPIAATAAVCLAILLGVFIRNILIGSMSNVRKATEAGNYLDKSEVNITLRRDTYLFTNVQRREKSRKGGGGGSSGGGSHGGGGGKF